MKEDLAIAKNNILSLFEENANLKKSVGVDSNTERMDEGGGEHVNNKKAETSLDNEDLKAQLENEKKLRQEAEKELNLQVRPYLNNLLIQNAE